MHELSIAVSLVEEITRDAQERGLNRVTSISLAVGKRAHLLPQALQSCFDLLKTGTIMADAELQIEITEAEFVCRHCGWRELRDTLWSDCADCGRPALLAGGAELEIREYEGEVRHGGKSD
jgi:hydrogenase nickel incorporation protein HypA/HybF